MRCSYRSFDAAFVVKYETTSRINISPFDRTVRELYWWGPANARWCPYAHFDTTEICGVSSCRIYQRQDHTASAYVERKWSLVSQRIWERWYFISTVGGDAAMIQDYIRRTGHNISVMSSLIFYAQQSPLGGPENSRNERLVKLMHRT